MNNIREQQLKVFQETDRTTGLQNDWQSRLDIHRKLGRDNIPKCEGDLGAFTNFIKTNFSFLDTKLSLKLKVILNNINSNSSNDEEKRMLCRWLRSNTSTGEYTEYAGGKKSRKSKKSRKHKVTRKRKGRKNNKCKSRKN